jgi:Lsr2
VVGLEHTCPQRLTSQPETTLSRTRKYIRSQDHAGLLAQGRRNLGKVNLVAQKTIVTMVCDIPHDGEVDGTESISFAFDGSAYEIDLCGVHSKEIRDKLAGFADYARKAAPVARARRVRVNPGRRSADVRAWARDHGYEVSERGRIPSKIISDYEAAH